MPRKTIDKDVFAERLLQGVSEATRSLLMIRNYKESIQLALEILGDATLVDRVYVFRLHAHSTTNILVASQNWEWAKDKMLAEINNLNLQNLPFLDIFPRWHQKLSVGQSISGMLIIFLNKNKRFSSHKTFFRL
ncbi:MAG: hypothetical protein HC934_00080 [Acaryochloridaceae cyanobacterium SU_2_1]|nr:hypothetical protein [Acaryochloridaceae cyanobacterium SU_2_1]